MPMKRGRRAALLVGLLTLVAGMAAACVLGARYLIARRDLGRIPTMAAGPVEVSGRRDGLLVSLESAARMWAACSGPRRDVLDVLVLVPDEIAFLEAIAGWDEHTWYPVLLDDPERVIAFARSFRPRKIVRFEGDPARPRPGWDAAVAAVVESWTTQGEKPRHSGARAPALDVPAPPGVVLSKAGSPLLMGAVALAAGRFQPLLPWDEPTGRETLLSRVEATGLESSLERVVGRAVSQWRNLGDGCDFVTLAADWPYRYEVEEDPARGIYCLDDWLGRDASTGRRWAYLGRLAGGPADGVYQAMCSLFLTIDSALLFNTYTERAESAQGWAAYDVRPAATSLAELGSVTVRRGDGQAGRSQWRELFPARSGYGLVIVNSSGGSKSFSLQGETGGADDLPPTEPAVVLFNHSFSAADPYDPDTIAGRWLANGAFAYYGAINEPYLQAFRTPLSVADLLMKGMPLAAVVRRDLPEAFGAAWRLILVGDPLFAIRGTTTGPRREAQQRPGWRPLTEADSQATAASAAQRLDQAYGAVLLQAARGESERTGPRMLELIRAIPRKELDPAGQRRLDALTVTVLSQDGAWRELREYVVSVEEPDRSARLRQWLGMSKARTLEEGREP